jgi:SpoVK/Ycf46/Vps4 family AAA+-type ATPase
MSQSQRFDSQYEEPFPHPSAAVPVVTQDPSAATMLLMVGLPGAGKTARAKELAAAKRALRLTPTALKFPELCPILGDSIL